MKKIIRIFTIIVLFLCFFNSNMAYATQNESKDKESRSNWKDLFKYADEFTNGNIEWDMSDDNLSDTDKKALKENIPSVTEIEASIKSDANSIYNILLAIGTILTVIVGAVLGIQYMMASAEDKAKVKEKMIPYIVGCIVIYGAFTIWYIVVEVLGKMS